MRYIDSEAMIIPDVFSNVECEVFDLIVEHLKMLPPLDEMRDVVNTSEKLVRSFREARFNLYSQ